jgi:hypothetical protein
MTGFLFFLALLAPPLIGYGLLNWLPPFRALHWASRFGLAGCLGALLLCAEMLLLTSLRISWSVGLLLGPAVLLAICRRRRPRAQPEAAVDRKIRYGMPALMLIVSTLAATAYAAGTGRATSTDLLFFWGTKGQRFAQTRGIDVGFLKDPAHLLMHADYPPMLPCLYAWSALIAGKFEWGAALLSLPVFLTLTILTFYGFARRALTLRESLEQASLLGVLLAFVMIAGYTAGNAEPLLVYFEVTALSALIFAADRAEGVPAAAVALAGAALTKVEGIVFAALVVAGALLFLRGARRWRSLVLLAGAPMLALGAWVLFCRFHGFQEVYALHSISRPTLAHLSSVLGQVGHQASYGFWFVPWIAVFILSLPGKPTRTSLIALTVALGFAAFILYAYLTSNANPHLWIEWSASRVLITPLVSLFFYAAAKATAVDVAAVRTLGAKEPRSLEAILGGADRQGEGDLTPA